MNKYHNFKTKALKMHLFEPVCIVSVSLFQVIVLLELVV